MTACQKHQKLVCSVQPTMTTDACELFCDRQQTAVLTSVLQVTSHLSESSSAGKMLNGKSSQVVFCMAAKAGLKHAITRQA